MMRSGSPASSLVEPPRVQGAGLVVGADKRRLTTLYRLARPYRLRTVLAIVFLLGATAISLVPPLLIGLAVNEVAEGRDGRAAVDRRRASSAPASIGLGCSYGQTYFTGWTGERMLADLRNHLFRHLQRLSLGFYERNRAGALISRITNDVEALDQLVTDGVTSLVQNSLTLIGTAVIMFFLDWRLAWRRSRSCPLLAVGTTIFRSKSARSYRRVRERLGNRHGDARRGHRRDARAAGVHARARGPRELLRDQQAVPGRQPRDRRPERALLPVRRPALDDLDGDRARLRRLPRLRGRHDDRRR